MNVVENRKLEEIEDLNEFSGLLSHFLTAIKKKNDTQHEPGTIRDCQRSIDIYLKNKKYIKKCHSRFLIDYRLMHFA